MNSTIEKAIFKVLEGDFEGEIKVMFNPDEYSLPLTVKWKEKPEMMPEFDTTSYGNFTINLVYDTYEDQTDVREGESGTNKICQLTLPSAPGDNRNRPPKCRFVWGSFHFIGVVEKVEQKFTMFLSNGTPVRAKLTVTMRPVFTEKELNELNGYKNSRKFYTVRIGDRLDLIARSELHNPSLWTVIANVNHIEDPMNFPGPADYGRTLIIPHMEK